MLQTLPLIIALLSPYIDDTTYAIGHIDFAKIDRKTLRANIDEIAGPEAKTINGAVDKTLDAFAKAKASDIYVLARIGNRPEELLIVIPRGKDLDVPMMSNLLKELIEIPNLDIQVRDDVILAGRDVKEYLRDLQPKENPGLASGLDSVSKDAIGFAGAPPTFVTRGLLEIYPKLPPELGAGPSTVVARGVQWASIGVSVTDKTRIHATVKGEDKKAAEDLKQVALKGLDTLKTSTDPALKALVGLLLQDMSPKIDGDRLTSSVDGKTLVTLLSPLVVKMRESALRTASINNLKQLALAMHAYHDANKTLPPAAKRDPQGKALLSWRVLILPYIGQENLFKQFHVDEPWDSENNKKLISQIPKIYQSPLSKNAAPGNTTYLVPVGPNMVFEGPDGMKLQDMRDGTSNTIMIVDANDSKAVTWTQPEDYLVDPKAPAAGLIRPDMTYFLAAFADGSVRVISNTLAADQLYGLFTHNGREIVGLPE